MKVNAMKKTRLVILVALIGALGTWSCKPKPLEISPEIAASDEALYKAGQEILKKDAEKARLYFRQVIDSFPKSFYAQRAKLAVADSYFEKGDVAHTFADIQKARLDLGYAPRTTLKDGLREEWEWIRELYQI